MAYSPFTRAVVSRNKLNPSYQIDLVPQAVGGGVISLLKGSLRTVIATKSKTWKVDDLVNANHPEQGTKPNLNDTKATFDDVLYLMVKDVKPIPNGISVEFEWLRSHTQMDYWGTSSAMRDGIRVLDNNGETLERSGGSGRGMFGMSSLLGTKLQGGTVNYKFTRTKKNSATGALQLAWKYPTELSTVEMPFEFRDLPLP